MKRKQKYAKRSIPSNILKQDPSKLFQEIENLRALEARGTLDGPGRLKRVRLEQKFASLNRAREKAKLTTMQLLPFDPQIYQKDKGEHYEMSHTIQAPLYCADLIQLDDNIELPKECPPDKGVPGLPSYRIDYD